MREKNDKMSPTLTGCLKMNSFTATVTIPPGGTSAQPESLATKLMYSLEVAQVVKVFAASLALELAGIARDQEYSQALPLSVTWCGA